MKIRLFYILSIFTLIASNTQNAFASCEVGPILFRDTLYGAAIGGGVGALVLIANSDSSNIAPTFAASALVGAGAGLLTGIFEISLSNCSGGGGGGHKKNRDENYGYELKVRPMFSVADNLNLNKIGGGMTFEYTLN
ncbi:MAG: hypothetical protein V4591_01870 [Bdellovibrionota bacterium]